jgi:hypothetical protein
MVYEYGFKIKSGIECALMLGWKNDPLGKSGNSTTAAQRRGNVANLNMITFSIMTCDTLYFFSAINCYDTLSPFTNLSRFYSIPHESARKIDG